MELYYPGCVYCISFVYLIIMYAVCTFLMLMCYVCETLTLMFVFATFFFYFTSSKSLLGTHTMYYIYLFILFLFFRVDKHFSFFVIFSLFFSNLAAWLDIIEQKKNRYSLGRFPTFPFFVPSISANSIKNKINKKIETDTRKKDGIPMNRKKTTTLISLYFQWVLWNFFPCNSLSPGNHQNVTRKKIDETQKKSVEIRNATEREFNTKKISFFLSRIVPFCRFSFWIRLLDLIK